MVIFRDNDIKLKKIDNLKKYIYIRIEVATMRDVHATLVPIVIEALVSIPQNLRCYIEIIGILEQYPIASEVCELGYIFMENLHNARSSVENANRAKEYNIMLPSVGMLLTHSVVIMII